MTTFILAGSLVGTAGAAQAAPVTTESAGSSTAVTVRTVTTEQVRAMVAQGGGQLIAFNPPAAAATSVTCYMDIGLPYGGGAYNSHVFVDGYVYCDDYVDIAVLTLELFRGTDRVAYKTTTLVHSSAIYSTTEYGACNEGTYFGIVGVTVTRWDLTPQSITKNVIGYPSYIGCGPPPPPSPGPLVVNNPGTRTSLTGNAERLQFAATGGTTPYRWSAGNLPTGLSINASTGLVTGTPTRTGYFPVTVTAVDAASRTASVQFNWVIKNDGCARC